MKYSYLFLILSILWTFYLFNSNTGPSDNTESMKPNIQKRNIYSGETDHNKAFMSAAIRSFFQKKGSNSKNEIHIEDQPARFLTNVYKQKSKKITRPLQNESSTNFYKQPILIIESPDIGSENEYGEGVAIAISTEQEKVGAENEFGEGIAISSNSFDQKNGYDNVYGEGVAADIDPILEELTENTPKTALQSESWP